MQYLIEIRHWVDSIAHFKNAGHEKWFYVSLINLILCILLYWLIKIRWHYLFMSVYNSSFSIMAFIVVILLQIKSKTFSFDCIWFNGLMAGIYFMLYFLAKTNKKLKSDHLAPLKSN